MQDENFVNSSTKSRNISSMTKYRGGRNAQCEKAILASGEFYKGFQMVVLFQLASQAVGTIVASTYSKSPTKEGKENEERRTEERESDQKDGVGAYCDYGYVV
jgi:hypothetical protein